MRDILPSGNYRDLIAWKKAFDLALAIYRGTACFPDEEKYGITSQLRRAGVSVASNIAEGQGRNSKAEFRHYLSFAQGSLKEIETQLLIAIALGYCGDGQAAPLFAMASEVGRLINGLSRSLAVR
jgi:four helix bundle protein